MASRALTPTLIICGAAAIAGGIALARPGTSTAAPDSAVTAAADPTVTTTNPAAGSAGAGGSAGANRGNAGGGAYGANRGNAAGPAGAAGANREKAAGSAGAGANRGNAGGAGAGATLTIRGFAFNPPASVSPGARVQVVNADNAPHTATGRGFDSGTVSGGARGSFTAPSAPGTYRFACEIHPSMTGSLTVR